MFKFKIYQHYQSVNNYKFALIPTITISKITLKKQPNWIINLIISIDFLNYSLWIQRRYHKPWKPTH